MGKKTEPAKKAASPAITAKASAKVPAAAPAKSAPAKPVPAKPAPVKSLAKKVEPKKPAAKKSSKPAISSDDIALRAYFIAEKRQALGLPGDSHQDWIEAEHQLRADLKKVPAKKKAKA